MFGGRGLLCKRPSLTSQSRLGLGKPRTNRLMTGSMSASVISRTLNLSEREDAPGVIVVLMANASATCYLPVSRLDARRNVVLIADRCRLAGTTHNEVAPTVLMLM